MSFKQLTHFSYNELYMLRVSTDDESFNPVHSTPSSIQTVQYKLAKSDRSRRSTSLSKSSTKTIHSLLSRTDNLIPIDLSPSRCIFIRKRSSLSILFLSFCESCCAKQGQNMFSSIIFNIEHHLNMDRCMFGYKNEWNRMIKGLRMMVCSDEDTGNNDEEVVRSNKYKHKFALGKQIQELQEEMEKSRALHCSRGIYNRLQHSKIIHCNEADRSDKWLKLWEKVTSGNDVDVCSLHWTEIVLCFMTTMNNVHCILRMVLDRLRILRDTEMIEYISKCVSEGNARETTASWQKKKEAENDLDKGKMTGIENDMKRLQFGVFNDEMLRRLLEGGDETVAEYNVQNRRLEVDTIADLETCSDVDNTNGMTDRKENSELQLGSHNESFTQPPQKEDENVSESRKCDRIVSNTVRSREGDGEEENHDMTLQFGSLSSEVIETLWESERFEKMWFGSLAMKEWNAMLEDGTKVGKGDIREEESHDKWTRLLSSRKEPACILLEINNNDTVSSPEVDAKQDDHDVMFQLGSLSSEIIETLWESERFGKIWFGSLTMKEWNAMLEDETKVDVEEVHSHNKWILPLSSRREPPCVLVENNNDSDGWRNRIQFGRLKMSTLGGIWDPKSDVKSH